MALPSTSATSISLADLQTEYGGIDPISLSEYYAGGTYVSSGASGTYGTVPISPNTISLANFYGTNNIILTGYWGGGATGTSTAYNLWTAEIQGITFSTEAATNPAAALVQARYQLSGFNSSTRGYFAGGSNNSVASSEVDAINFAGETAHNPAAVLAIGSSFGIDLNSTTTGYYPTFSQTVNTSTTSNKFLFSTETASTLSTYFLYGSAGSGANSSTKGYMFLGLGANGVGAGPGSVVHYLLFSNETSVSLTASSSEMQNGPYFNSSTKGYTYGGREFGGYGLNVSTNVMSLSFSTETLSLLAAVPPVTLYFDGASGVNSTTKGYIGGGPTAALDASTSTREIQGLLFSNETAINPAAVLAVAADYNAGVQSGAL